MRISFVGRARDCGKQLKPARSWGIVRLVRAGKCCDAAPLEFIPPHLVLPSRRRGWKSPVWYLGQVVALPSGSAQLMPAMSVACQTLGTCCLALNPKHAGLAPITVPIGALCMYLPSASMPRNHKRRNQRQQVSCRTWCIVSFRPAAFRQSHRSFFARLGCLGMWAFRMLMF